MNQELTYWVALAHTPKIWTSRKNEIIVHCFKQGKTIADFFESSSFLDIVLKPLDVELLHQTKSELANYAFLVEEILDQGYDIVPITSEEYSSTLKTNLKYNSPIILYTKGNKQLLHEESVAIVGSRNANDTSLAFTDIVAKRASSEYKVVVSGFAKGVDKQALDSALKYKGQSIIVLPQGITTFASGMKKYYKQIIEGNVLVLSTFHPKSPWSVELAMARNSIIYGLASEIYVAQSDDKGGTWNGVCDGLKKKRTIYVRKPNGKEKCANMTLINMGATPVDFNGDKIPNMIQSTIDYEMEEVSCSVVAEEPVPKQMKNVFFIRAVIFVIFASAFASCAMVRGYRADGLYGPNIFSFEHHEHDTVPNGDPITKYLPELKGKDPRWEKLTIRYLLCMFSGLDFDDEYEFNIKELKTVNAIARLNYGHNMMKQIRGLKFRCDPGTEFRYESMTTAILGVVIERATGRHYADYLSEKVWKPLQMESVALINIDSRKHHAAHVFGSITCTLKDLAKIGRLYLNNGVWDGKRIVSEEWIHLTTDYYPKACYHYSWYDVRYEGFETGQYPGFYALGICNQVLYVNPHQKLIMVRIGKSNNGPAVIPAVFEQLSNAWPL